MAGLNAIGLYINNIIFFDFFYLTLLLLDSLIELSYHEGQKKQIKPSLMKFCIQKQAEQSDIAVMRRTAEVYGII